MQNDIGCTQMGSRHPRAVPYSHVGNGRDQAPRGPSRSGFRTMVSHLSKNKQVLQLHPARFFLTSPEARQATDAKVRIFKE
jgi:hypothetical protein